MNKVELTEKEIIVLKKFKDDDFVSDVGWENPKASTWVEDFHKDCKMSGKEFSGVMSSLVKKDIIWSTGESFGLKDAGREFLKTL
jgi:hypothetical protein